MEKTIIAEGKTTNEAIENGLKELKVSKDRVNIKVLESEDKRSFFSILAPRVVKVELTLKEEKESKPKKEIELSEDEKNKAIENVKTFLNDFINKLNENNEISYNVEFINSYLNISINCKDLGYLIGYRGETLYAMQNILSSIAGKGISNRVKVILDIEGYKEKREKTLESLAEKVAKTVLRTRKPIKLEPMKAYERKIIHTKLQNYNKIDTSSVGEEPYRRIVVSIKNK